MPSTAMKNVSTCDPDLLIGWLKTSSGKTLFDFRAEKRVSSSTLGEIIREPNFSKRIDTLYPNGDPYCPHCSARPARVIYGLMESFWHEGLTPPLLYDFLAGRLDLGGCSISHDTRCPDCGHGWNTGWQEKMPPSYKSISYFCSIEYWENLPYTAGIYEIETPDGLYIGQSRNIRKRIGEHVGGLKNSNHTNYRLQRAYDRAREQNGEINALSIDLAPISLTDNNLMTWLLRREAYWIQQKRELINLLNIAKPEEQPFDKEVFNAEKLKVEQGIARLPTEIDLLQRDLPNIKEETLAQISVLELKLVEEIEGEWPAQSKRWLYVGLILVAGAIISWVQQEFTPFGFSLTAAAWFGIFGPRGDAPSEEVSHLSFELHEKKRFLKTKQDELSEKKKELAEIKRMSKRIKKEEEIFFAE